MDQYVADANFIISLIDSSDSCHKKAERILHFLHVERSEMIVNNAIVYEILTVLSRKDYKKEAIKLYEWMRQAVLVKIAHCDDQLERRAFFYFTRIQIAKISFFDCTIFATADAYNTKYIVSFDKHLRNKTDHTIIHDPNQLS